VLFKTFFNFQDDDEEIVLPTFFTASEMLDHQVSDFRTLFIGTCGHFLSIAKSFSH
jgi:hypothetical protein